jgi:hypothetical protein
MATSAGKRGYNAIVFVWSGGSQGRVSGPCDWIGRLASAGCARCFKPGIHNCNTSEMVWRESLKLQLPEEWRIEGELRWEWRMELLGILRVRFGEEGGLAEPGYGDGTTT